jgi:DNA-binding NarL/FixJ family response regulator
MQIVIADDHPIFRSGLKFLIESSFNPNELQVVEFANGQDAYDYILKTPTLDLAILDVDMPGLSGLEVSKLLNELNHDIKVIILTMHKDIEMLKLAIAFGVRGYLIKDNTSEELVECMLTVQQGKKFYSKSVRQFSTNEFEGNLEKSAIVEHLQQLTKTELKTLKLVSQKLSSKEIADLMFVSVKSVENYRSRICKKLQLDARNNSLLLWVMEYKSYLDLVEEF